MAKKRLPSERLGTLLEALDALCDGLTDEQAEALEDMNAELEDAMMLLDEIRPGDADWQEEYADALEALGALAADYRELSGRIEGLMPLAGALQAEILALRTDVEGEL